MKKMILIFVLTFLLYSVEGSPLLPLANELAYSGVNIVLNVTIVNILGVTLSGCDASDLGFQAEGIIQRSGGAVYELPLVNCPTNSLTRSASATVGESVYATLYNPATNTYIDGPKHVLTNSDISNGIVNVSVVL